jgi:RimJ/RimL family protein N-acetyltransferase
MILKKVTTDDEDFIYNIIKNWLKDFPEQTVTVTEVTKEELFLKPAERYIIDDYKGFVQLFPSNEIGYYLKPEYYNKGIGTIAVKELMKLHQRQFYFVTVSNENPASIKLAKKIGFKPKGQILLYSN